MGVHADDVDDVVQQTVLKALGETFESEQHLVAWSVVAARNLIISEGRRRSVRARAAALLSVQPIADDVEDLVLAKLKQESLAGLIEKLPANHRAALAAESSGIDRRADVRIAVMRHRTRKQLRSAYDRLGVVVGTWQARLRLSASEGFDSPVASAVGATVLGLIGLGVAAASLSGHGSAPDPTAPPVAQRVGSVSPVTFHRGGGAPQDLPPNGAVSSRSETPGGVGLPGRPFRVPLGTDSEGNPRSIDRHRAAPEEEGVLLCVGRPSDEGSTCMMWPEPVEKLIESAVGFAFGGLK